MNSNGGLHGEEEESELGFGLLRYMRRLEMTRFLNSSRVRQYISRSAFEIPVASESPPVQSSLQRQRSSTTMVSSEKSPLESLPQNLLVRVILRVDHKDMKSLIFVSKSISEACLIAKESYTTPEKTRASRNSLDLAEILDPSHQEDDDIEVPNAPYRSCWAERKTKEQLSRISKVLFK